VSASSLITPDQLAEAWGVPKSHIYRLAREGHLPCIRLGKYMRFQPDQVAAFLSDGGTGKDNR